MISFLICLALLIGGYFLYGKVVENTFGPDDRETPAVKINDGVDYVVLPQWKLFMIQLLNIAGLGPIFGALQGALWGPIVFLWITFGTIFAGGVHDYFSGMMSERNNGASISEISGIYLGGFMKNVMRVFSVVLLIMVGTVFAVGPAGLIVTLFKNGGSNGIVTTTLFWLIIVLVYYFIATFLSIDKIIGKIYPVFGICLIVMAAGVIIGIFVKPEYTIPELWDNFRSMHPSGTPVWSFMFITVACGAISGFHSTQSPLMARCMKSEKQGHFVFYGAMVSEGIIALVWAAAGCALYEVTGGLNTGLAEILANGQSAAIYDVCIKTMGKVGVALAMLGVIACPITSGDTAFRSARLVLADWFKLDQKKWKNRLLLCVPVLGVGTVLGVGNALGAIDYTIIWRYFSWTNQTLAMIVLWAASMYLFYDKKNYWLTAVPATFMSAVSATYFLLGNECLGQLINHKAADGTIIYNTAVAYPVGIAVAALFLGIFLYTIKKRHTQPHYETLGK
ncbi:MAG: carbon starvation CstA family protein [Oscillospiraceae bacterium]|nr:carbon starvation CstA family protein [Oscillospiraceae bacterium]